MAAFWAEVLGSTVSEGATAESAAVDGAPRLAFHQVPEAKQVKNRLHLDLLSKEFDVELERLLGLGASQVNEVRQGGAHWITLADPEGNEFDLVEG